MGYRGGIVDHAKQVPTPEVTIQLEVLEVKAYYGREKCNQSDYKRYD
jgi:hypothetical protein